MTFISRILLSNSNLLKFNKRGVFSTYVTQKLLPATIYGDSYSHIDIANKNNDLRIVKRFAYSRPFRKSRFYRESWGSKLTKANLPMIVDNYQDLPKGILIGTVYKLCTLYYLYRADSNFQKELKYFSESPVFKKFCMIIEEELPKIMPYNLSILIELIHFNISPNSPLIRKILLLILDNLHCFSIIDLIELYGKLIQPPFLDIDDAKQIRAGCETLFETSLEEELSYINNIKDLLYNIPNKQLPLKVRQLIVERFLREIDEGKYKLSYFPQFFTAAFKEPILSLNKPQLLERFKLILLENQLPQVYFTFSEIYKKGIEKHDHLYDEEICKILAKNILSFHSVDYAFAKILNDLCIMGYYDIGLVHKLIDTILSGDFSYIKYHTVLNIASTFARTSYHEMNNPNWNKIKSLLESFNINKFVTDVEIIFQFWEYLMFLGCDITDVVSNIFKQASEQDGIHFGFPVNPRSILRLHHCCKKYFPDSDVGLPKKAVSKFLQSSIYKKSFYHLAGVHELFGSTDYVLYNCLTSDFNFLPIVALLGPDNEPVNLSAYKTDDLNQNYGRNFNVTTNINKIKKEGCKVIAFLNYPDYQPFQYRNAPVTSGYLRMFLKLYEGVDYNIVLLTPQYFNLDDSKKLQYLKSEINKITEKSGTTASLFN